MEDSKVREYVYSIGDDAEVKAALNMLINAAVRALCDEAERQALNNVLERLEDGVNKELVMAGFREE